MPAAKITGYGRSNGVEAETGLETDRIDDNISNGINRR